MKKIFAIVGVATIILGIAEIVNAIFNSGTTGSNIFGLLLIVSAIFGVVYVSRPQSATTSRWAFWLFGAAFVTDGVSRVVAGQIDLSHGAGIKLGAAALQLVICVIYAGLLTLVNRYTTRGKRTLFLAGYSIGFLLINLIAMSWYISFSLP